MIPLTKLRRRGYNSNYPLNRGLIRNWASDFLDAPQAGTGSLVWRTKFPGTPHTLTINGGALWYPALDLQGQKRSIYLDGSNDSLKANTPPFTTYPFSIAFWHKTSAASSAMLWWCGEADFGNWRAFYGTSSTTAVNAIAIQNTPTNTASTTIGYTQDKWYLYTGVYASTTDRSCYINGGNKGTNTDSCNPTNINEFFIGAARRFGSPDTNTAGNFADIRIWNRALTDGEVSQLYHDSVRSFDRMNNSITYMFFGAVAAGASTFTGTAAVTCGAVTASGTATSTAPIYSGNAAVTVGAATCSGSATHTAPLYTGNAAVTCGAATCSGTATSTDPIYSGNAAVTCGAATCSGVATSTDPIYTGTSAVTVGAATASGTAQFASAIYSGNVAVTCGAATASGTATHTTPTFTGLAAVVTAAVTASGSATHTAPIYSGSAAVTTGPATATGAATFTSTTRTGTAAVTTGATTASGTATFVAPAYDTGTGYVNFADQYFFGGIL